MFSSLLIQVDPERLDSFTCSLSWKSETGFSVPSFKKKFGRVYISLEAYRTVLIDSQRKSLPHNCHAAIDTATCEYFGAMIYSYVPQKPSSTELQLSKSPRLSPGISQAHQMVGYVQSARRFPTSSLKCRLLFLGWTLLEWYSHGGQRQRAWEPNI